LLSSITLVNALPSLVLNAFLAITVAAALVIDLSGRFVGWRAAAVSIAAAVCLPALAAEGQLFYPRFLMFDLQSGLLVASGFMIIVACASLLWRHGRFVRVIVAVGAAVASGAVVDPAATSALVSWVVPGAATLLLLLPVHLAYVIYELQREALRSESERAELAQKLTLASAELLEQRNRESLSLVAAGISHEINNPLTYAMGNIELLRELELPLRDEVRDALGSVEHGLRSISAVVSRIRSLFKESGTIAEPVALREAVQAAISASQKGGALNVPVANRIPEDVAAVANPADIYIVAVNLIRNASEACRDSQSDCVEVAYETDGSDAAIVVRDHGVGMSPDQVRRCFDPFYSTKSDAGGMGVGLALCRVIAERTGSSIDVDSTPGRGTTVHFWIRSREE
jgi:signal transduction histidine kinase